MAPGDEEKTAFITPHGFYCYRVMSFGLKNARATYQRLMTKIFKPLIGDIVEVQMRIQCKLGEVPKVHGYPKRNRNQSRLGENGREHACTNKQEAVAMPHWQTHRSRTVHSSIHRQDEAFLPGTPRSVRYLGKDYLYLAVTDWAVSAVLLCSLSPREQRPVYFISKAFADAETRYSRMEQTALALRTAAQKLRPYFQAHPITVFTNQPLRNVLHKSDITGRMLRWAIELNEYGIDYQPRLSLKGQVMADFIAELPEVRAPDKKWTPDDWWSLHVDGASRSSGSGVELLLKAPTGERLEQSIRLDFPASNNEAEYEVILSGVGLAITLNASKVKIHSDSQLVVGQILKEYEAKDERMAKYLLKVQESLSRLGEWVIEKIPRGENVQADALAGIAASFPEYDWAVDIRTYLQTGALPEDPKRAHKIRVQASLFTLIGGDLYRRSFGGVCGNHSRGRTLVHQAHSQGYYLPTMSKWVEAEAYASIKDKDAKRFLCGTSHQKPVFHAAADNTPGRPTGNTPFALTYGTDVIIPTEMGMPIARTAVQGQRNEDDELARHLDCTNEARVAASIRMAAYQQKVAAYYNRRVRPRIFKERSLFIPPGEEFCPANVPPYPDILHQELCLADVPPYPDISHPEFCPADVPPSPDISHPAPTAGWERRAIQLPQLDMSGSSGSAYLENIHS
ncbi:hypothetical protein CK203_035147 [Vitis vinifera]|uniref:RNase H type-1 domain-containing protein n=1 Tax=Vitis vinifera TaxID=29760 RepID=A0A438HAG0_VITVI|nr:hypothetical protein CK203_035147 [Vitis vinifera]